ncbi:FecR family protein [Chitinophaga silvatica]|uniref:FecR family protein n=1 Tax=Chitinophaga silvatica TaxID=2282649 RepID=A0A3E1Y2B4_9BACT|nr:FecR family protein [Chitinophaga silvatica]RFS18804.1 FecR family protein [Chitinophaga silvatica]
MEHADKNIDWDKLLALSDGDLSGEDIMNLTEEEREQLRVAVELKLRIKEEQLLARFPVEEGWKRFQNRPKVHRTIFSYWKMAAAILLLLTSSITVWLFTTKKTQTPQLANYTPSHKAEIRLANGKVLVLCDSAETEKQGIVDIKATNNAVVYAANNASNTTVRVDTLIVPRGNKVSLELSDGTKVTLNAASSLIFPSSFNGNTRSVTLTGEGYFEVNGNENSPFIVQTAGINVKVLGTAFNVNAYDQTIYTTLVNGKVQVATPGKLTVLKPGEQHLYDITDRKEEITKVETPLYTAWQEGIVYFEHSSLLSITKVLSRDYDYDFVFNDKELMDAQFRLEIPHPTSLQLLLDQISRISGNITFTVKNRVVYIDKK